MQKLMLEEARTRNDLDGVATGYSNLAYFYSQNRQYEEGADYKMKFTELAERYGLAEQEASSLRETGLIYERGGNYLVAIELFEAAAEKFQVLDNT